MNISHNQLVIKPYTKKELAEIYGISTRSFCTWFKKIEPQIGKKVGKYFSVNQVLLIIDKLGLPGTIGENPDQQPNKDNTQKK